jgi:hypothetical protein
MNIRAKDHPDWCCGPHTTTLKQDRCSKVAAACLRKTAELINQYVTVGYTAPDFHAGKPYEPCLDCHSYVGGSPDPTKREDAVGQMDCLTCHNNQIGNYMSTEAISILDVYMTFQGSDEPEWQFSPGDDVTVHVVFTCNQGPGGKAVITADSWWGVLMPSGPPAIQALNKADGAIGAGAHHWTWDSTVPSGAKVPGRGRTRIGLKAYDHPGGDFEDGEIKQIDYYIVP